MSSKQKLTIAVTGLNNTDNPGPGIPVIRSLRDSQKFDLKILGLAYENLEPGIYMHDLVDRTFRIPYPSEGSEILVNRIIEISKDYPIDVLIPNFDAELLAFMKSEKKLADAGIATFLPGLKQFEERHKANLPDFGTKYNIKVPSGRHVSSLNELRELTENSEFPLVIKGKFYDAYIARTREQAADYFHRLSAKWGLPVIIQEYITGTEVNVIALGDGKGNTIAAVPMRKLYITDKGKAWAGITLDDQEMLELTFRLIRSTKWKGGMELELIKTSEGEYYLIEINPRIPAWVYLAAGAGQNIPEALVMLALGNEVKPFNNYRKGVIFIRYSYDLITDINEFEKLNIKGVL
jgi:carbamoyl-phosphate synthase large subunit